jgi:fatty acid desaturase
MNPSPEKYPIPARTNTAIIFLCTFLHCALLWIGSQVNGWQLILTALFFAINLIPIYSLVHEAEHGVLMPDKKWNYIGGLFLSFLFIAPFSFIRKCHLNHHKHNRTDYEMWDLYYEHQSRWGRQGYFYLVRMGLEWLMILLAIVLFCILPRLVFSKLFSWNREIRGVIEGTDQKKLLTKVRMESYAVVLFHVLLFVLLDLNAYQYILMYLFHAFLWSSQNYVNHAFSPRDIINGAHNSKTNLLFKYVYLNFHIHLAHHQKPNLPWIHLTRFVNEDVERISFWKNYLRLWKGPTLTNEVSPLPLED